MNFSFLSAKIIIIVHPSYLEVPAAISPPPGFVITKPGVVNNGWNIKTWLSCSKPARVNKTYHNREKENNFRGRSILNSRRQQKSLGAPAQATNLFSHEDQNVLVSASSAFNTAISFYVLMDYTPSAKNKAESLLTGGD